MPSPGDRGSMIGTRFFKIILQETVRDKKLLIPSRFVENCGEGLLGSATLKVPSGLSWTVEVARDEIGVWFRNGWQEFAEFHSLVYGHFLVFEYTSCSSFYVVICDRTATEIVYPTARTAQQRNGEIGEGFLEPKVEDVSDEVDAPQRRNNGKSTMEVSRSNCKTKSTRIRRRRGDSTRDGEVGMDSCSMRSAEGHHNSSAQGVGSNSVETGEEEEDCSDTMIREEPRSLRERKSITGFKSAHPFFDCRITASTLSRRQMYVPLGFSVRHIAKGEKSLELQVAEKTWPVTLGRFSIQKYVYFCEGWHGFAEGNSLKQGDICIFECVRRWTNVLLKVTIIQEC